MPFQSCFIDVGAELAEPSFEIKGGLFARRLARSSLDDDIIAKLKLRPARHGRLAGAAHYRR
jgi:hypothetical protein